MFLDPITELAQLLDVQQDSCFVFDVCGGICDPLTRPNNMSDVVSILVATDLLLAIAYSSFVSQNPDVSLNDAKFELALQIAHLVRKIHNAINADDELNLRYTRHADLDLWTPPVNVSASALRIAYAMTCVLLTTMYKLFVPSTGEANLSLNPFIQYFYSLWKCHTNIIILGLEVDRRIESINRERPTPRRTPARVRRALAGSSAVRCVLAWILNKNAAVDDFGIYNKDKLGNSVSSLLLGSNTLADPELSLIENEHLYEIEPKTNAILKSSNKPSNDDVAGQNESNIILQEIIRFRGIPGSPADKFSARNVFFEHIMNNNLANKKKQQPSATSDLEADSGSENREYDESLEDMECIDDFEAETVTDFLRPLVRKPRTMGALLDDSRLSFIVLLITSSLTNASACKSKPDIAPRNKSEMKRLKNQCTALAELGDMMVDLVMDDRYDEDIRYIFECEYDELGPGDDFEADDSDDPDKDLTGLEEDMKKYASPHEFGVMNKMGTSQGLTSKPSASRYPSADQISFDEHGRDWRDMPRGDNANYSQKFLEHFEKFNLLSRRDESPCFFATWDEMLFAFVFLCHTSIEDDVEVENNLGQVVLNTIAWAIKTEEDAEENSDQTSNSCPVVSGSLNKDKDAEDSSDGQVTPDRIFHFLFTAAPEELVSRAQEGNPQIIAIFEVSSFELLLYNNSKLSRCIVDELMMSKGYRRVIIWVLTHNMNLLPLLIDYIFELLVGLRGRNDTQKPYTFSRQGSGIVLSEIEQMMLLHEFFANSAQYLSESAGLSFENDCKVYLSDSVAIKYVSLLCLMINRLVGLGIISLNRPSKESVDNMHDFRTDLQLLLVNWVGKVSDARQIYISIQQEMTQLPELELQVQPVPSETDSPRKLIFDYSRKWEKALFDLYKNMSVDQIDDDLEVHLDHFEMIWCFSMRLDCHICYLLRESLPELKMPITKLPHTYPKHLERDIAFFFEHFDTFCRVEHIIDALFKKFHKIVTTFLNKEQVSADENESGSSKEMNTKHIEGERSSKKKKKKKKTKRK